MALLGRGGSGRRGEGSRVAGIGKLQEAGLTHQPAGLGGWAAAPHAPLWALPPRPKVLCHALSCGSGSLIPEFWEAWAEFPEGVSQFSKQIGWLVVTAEPGGPTAQEAGGGDWWPQGTQELPPSLCKASTSRDSLAPATRRKGETEAQEGKALARGHTVSPGFKSRFLDGAPGICLTEGQKARASSKPPNPNLDPEASLSDESRHTGKDTTWEGSRFGRVSGCPPG